MAPYVHALFLQKHPQGQSFTVRETIVNRIHYYVPTRLKLGHFIRGVRFIKSNTSIWLKHFNG